MSCGRDHFKSFAEIQVVDNHWSSFVNWCSHFIVEGHRLVKHDVCVLKPSWLSKITSFFCMCLALLPEVSVSLPFQAQRWRLLVCSFLSLAFYLYKLERCFPFSRHQRHHLMAMTFWMWWKVAWPLHQLFSLWHAWDVSSGPTDMYMFSLIRWTWICSLLTVEDFQSLTPA